MWQEHDLKRRIDRSGHIPGFGQYLAAQRKALRWSQEELAERSTVSVRTIRNLETGTIRYPRRSSRELLLAALKSAGVAAYPVEELAAPAPRKWPRPTNTRWRGPWIMADALVGREDDLARIGSVRVDRCLTLIGPGGVGKTALALEAAHHLCPTFRDGVAVISMGELADAGPSSTDPDPDAVFRATLDAVAADRASGHDRGPDQDLQRLVILDNAEHVLDAVNRVAQHLLLNHPGVCIIITSRHALAVPSIRTWEVGPLGVGSDGESEAVKLFQRRARAACPTLDLTGRMAAVHRLCASLDNLPLAIELAALRLRSISLDDLLRNRPIRQIVRQVAEIGLPHQRTLAASVRWSYDLLDVEQQWLLWHLAGYLGPFTIEDVKGAGRKNRWRRTG